MEKKRFYRLVLVSCAILVFMLGYLAFVLLTDLKIPCIFNLALGVECPGCGITRMFVSLFHFDFAAAFRYNGFMLLTLPLVLFLVCVLGYSYVKTGRARLGKFATIGWLWIFAALLFAILRNFF